MDSIAYNYQYEASKAGLARRTRPSRASQRSVLLRRLLVTADIASALVSSIAITLIFGLDADHGAVLAGTLMVGSVLSAFVFGLYSDRDLLTWASGLADAPRMVIAAFLLSWTALVVLALLDVNDYVLVAAIATVLSAALDGLGRAMARGWAHRVTPLRQRTVIVGSGVVAERLIDRLASHAEFGLETIGLVDDEIHTVGEEGGGAPQLGNLDQLAEVIEVQQVDRVIIAFSRASHQELLDCIRTCRDHGVAVDIVPRLFELLDTGQVRNQIGGLPLLSVGVRPLTRASRIAKRTLDLVLSIAILLVLSPVLLAVAIAIKLDSRGPIFFRQVRAGRWNKRFKVFKFRSMYRDAEERKRQFDEANESGDGVMFKIKRDPRITRVGAFIRRTSLDELPQLFNVVIGDMSLVGPRPLILKEADQASSDWQARRLDLRPGMTGLWQVSGRSDIPFQEMIRFDYQYVSGWSVARDVEILLATIPAVLSGRGAY
jgi:exopolysaccharide biosynthesis polyprenyl glycosylphosphotransferase